MATFNTAVPSLERSGRAVNGYTRSVMKLILEDISRGIGVESDSIVVIIK